MIYIHIHPCILERWVKPYTALEPYHLADHAMCTTCVDKRQVLSQLQLLSQILTPINQTTNERTSKSFNHPTCLSLSLSLSLKEVNAISANMHFSNLLLPIMVFVLPS